MSLFTSLQARLVTAFMAVAMIALALAAGLFVAFNRDELERRELDRVAASAPAIFGRFFIAGEATGDLDAFADRLAEDHDVRVLLVDGSGTVVVDSSGRLEGERLSLPQENLRGLRFGRPYTTWSPGKGEAGAGLTLLTTSLPNLALDSGFRGILPGVGGLTDTGDPEGRLSLVLAVPVANIQNAWRDLLPGLSIAAAIALTVAAALGVVIARYVTRPVGRLTLASQRMAAGDFDIQLVSARRDEIGRLSRAFQEMATRVGTSQTEMRELVANVSHDLRTPLTSVLGFSLALGSGAVAGPEETRRLGGIIHEEAARLSSRLDDLLYLSELESGTVALRHEPVDAGALLESVAARLLGEVGARGLTVERSIAAGLVVEADAGRLERLLENLVANAARYTPDGGRILLSATRLADPPAAELAVANPAPGITEADVPRLFERFRRGDRARGAPGSGLGLPIARDIARLHGGSLDAALSPGGTLRFALRLPLAPGR